MKKLFYLSYLLLIAQHSSAQTEFLVTINPATGAFTKVKDIPGVKTVVIGPNFTVIDENSNRFLFKGGDGNGNFRLYTLNAATGNIISSTPFPLQQDSLDNFGSFQYDNSTNKFYGLQWDNSENREYFISANYTTGAFTKTDSIPGVKYISGMGGVTYDKNNQRYYFAGTDKTGTNRLYCINAANGNTLSNPAFPAVLNANDILTDFKYDNTTNKMYALRWNSTQKKWYLVLVDPATANFTDISSLPGVKYLINTGTFDELHHQFIFNGTDTSGNRYLYSIAANTGSITASPIFPVLNSPLDNVIALTYNNSNGILYGLHWGATASGIEPIKNESVKIYPNPFSANTTITLDKTYGEVNVFIYNAQGQVVRKENGFNTSTINIARETLPAGVYAVSVIGNHIEIMHSKIVAK